MSAADVLAGVEESGPNYALPTAREGQRERRERLRVDETAKQAGHTIVETGTHVEILGEQGLWWPATIAGREEDVDGRLVHEVEYDGYQGEQYWHMLDDEQWRRATAMPTPANGTNAAASTVRGRGERRRGGRRRGERRRGGRGRRGDVVGITKSVVSTGGPSYFQPGGAGHASLSSTPLVPRGASASRGEDTALAAHHTP